MFKEIESIINEFEERQYDHMEDQYDLLCDVSRYIDKLKNIYPSDMLLKNYIWKLEKIEDDLIKLTGV